MDKLKENVYEQLEDLIQNVLETYSNVHRGAGHFSQITTDIYEKARNVIMEFSGLSKKNFTVIFCSPLQYSRLKMQLGNEKFHVISSKDIGLPIGIRAVIVKKKILKKCYPTQTGGSAVKLVSGKSIVWADSPQKFEAGTPSIVNAIVLACALKLVNHNIYNDQIYNKTSAGSVKKLLYEDELSHLKGEELLRVLQNRFLGSNIKVPVKDGEIPFVNFDNAASTPAMLEVWNVVKKVWRMPQNDLNTLIDEVKIIISEFLNADLSKYEILFTSNTTEAINIAVSLIENELSGSKKLIVINTLIEHNSNELPFRFMKNAVKYRIGTNGEGLIDPAELEKLLLKLKTSSGAMKNSSLLVAVSAASNVLGSFTDIKAICEIAHKYGARILVDGAQITSHKKVDLRNWDADYIVFSGHKMYAPFGSGALVMKKEHIHENLELIKCSGEENAAGIAALGKAAMLLNRIGMDLIREKELKMTVQFITLVSEIEGIEIFGITDKKRLINKRGVISLAFKHIPHNLLAQQLAEQWGIGIRSGCFCAHMLVKNLLQFGDSASYIFGLGFTFLPRFSKRIVPGVIRVSFGLENTVAEIERLVGALKILSVNRVSPVNKIIAKKYFGSPFILKSNWHAAIEYYYNMRIEKTFKY